MISVGGGSHARHGLTSEFACPPSSAGLPALLGEVEA